MIKTTLMKVLEERPYTTRWQFGYYSEYLTLEKIDDKIKVTLELDSWDSYYPGVNSYTEIVTVDELIEFLNNRIAKEVTAVVNDLEIDMNNLLEEFCDLLKREVDKREQEKNIELFNSKISELEKLTPNYLDLPLNCSAEECEAAYAMYDFIRKMPGYINAGELNAAITYYIRTNKHTACVDEIHKIFNITDK